MVSSNTYVLAEPVASGDEGASAVLEVLEVWAAEVASAA
jgi:hypothetical protein